MANVGDIFSYLLSSNRRDKKVRLNQAITSLKSASIRKHLDVNSSNKWLGREANAFTWKSVCEIIQHLLQDELRVLTSRRTNTCTSSPEFSDAFRLLNIFLSCGLQTDLKLPLNEVLTFLCGILTDSKLSHVQSIAIDTMSALLWYLPVETQSIDAENLCHLLNWCFDQMKVTPSDAVALLLCHSVEASFYSRKLLLCGFADLLESVLTCFEHGWRDRHGLGWFLRLFRWTVAEVCVTPEVYRSLIKCFLKRASVIFKMWNDFKEAGCQIGKSCRETPTLLDVGDESSPALAHAVSKCLGDPYALDDYHIRVELLDNLFSISDNSSHHPSLLCDACFLVDEKPSLLPDKKNSRRPHPNSIDTGRELLGLSRCVLSTCLALKSKEFAAEIGPFCRLLAAHFTSEWSRCCNRMQFQAEDSLSSQLVGMQDLFATFGALLVVIETFKMTEIQSYLQSKFLIPESAGIYGFFAQLLSANELTGWLWWPVFDWMLRFQWQRTVAIESLHAFNWFEALEAISNMLDSTKRPLGVLYAMSTTITALKATAYCLKQNPKTLVDQLPCLERLWDQAIKWLEQLSVTKDREQRLKNERQLALMRDRLICCLLENLLKVDSVSRGSILPSRSKQLSRLWQILLSTPNFGNSLVPWRYRLTVSIYLVYPKVSMEILCSSNQRGLPSPILFLFESPGAFDIHRCYYLHWSLGLFLHPEQLFHELPSGDIVPDFGEKHQEMIKQFVKSKLSEPRDLLTRLFYYLITGTQIDEKCLQEAVDYVLSDFEQRNGLSSVLFELINQLPRQQWPINFQLLVQNLLIFREIKKNRDESVLDVDFDVISDASIDTVLGIVEDVTEADSRSKSFDQKINIPPAGFAYAGLLIETVACFQNILLPTLSWKCAKDTKWLVAFLQHLTKAKLSTTADETVIELFCCLIDALKEALKTQLILKRYPLFLGVLSGLNNFGLILCNYVARVSEEALGNEIWEQLASQVVKLAETAWIAGGSRWSKIEEDFLPSSVSSVFCGAVEAKVMLHSVGLISETISIMPLDVFLSQKDISTNFQVFKLLQRLSSGRQESLMSFVSTLVGFLSKMSGLKSPAILYILDTILFHLVSKLNRDGVVNCGSSSAKENLQYPSSSQLLKRGSNSQSPLSLIVSVCCCLIKHSDSSRLINQIVLKRLANYNETHFKNNLSPILLPLCLWEISNGQFDRSAHHKEFEIVAIVFGFRSFDEFLVHSSNGYGAFLRLAGVESMEKGLRTAEPIQIAAYLFAKDSFLDCIQRLKSTDVTHFKSLSSIESLEEVAKHLMRFILLFASDTTNDLENNASLISHHLISRLSILLLQLFPIYRVNSSEITKALFSSSTLEETVKKSSLTLSKSISLNHDFVLKLSEVLLEAACFLLEDSNQSSEDAPFDPLGGYYPRVCVWLAIARFLNLLSSTPNATETTRSYLNWRLISGIIDLMDVEYRRNRLVNIGFLLSSLSSILDEIVSHDNTTPSDQLEAAWHNSAVYLLAEISSKLPSLPDAVNLEFSDKIDHILAQLFHNRGGTRFSKAICQLDNVVTTGGVLSSYEPHLLSNCTCNRNDPDHEICRFLRTLNDLRYPNVLKYRATGFLHLISLLQPKSETDPLKLQERLVVLPHELEKSKASLAAASMIQNWVPPATTTGNTVLPNQNRHKLRKLLIGLLRTNDAVIIDSPTRSAIAECIAFLKSDFDGNEELFESFDEIENIFVDRPPDPLAAEKFRTLVTIVNKLTSPNTRFSKLGPQGLRTVLYDPQIRSNLLENINLSEAELSMSLITKCAPYVSKEDLSAVKGSGTQNPLKSIIRNISEPALGELCSKNLATLAKTCGSQKKPVILLIAEWLFEKDLVLDDFLQACRSLILEEVSVAKRLIPWIFVVLLVNLKITSNPRAAKLTERALFNLIESFNSLSARPETEGLIQSVLVATHSYSQWLIRRGATSRMEWSFDWLTSSRSALRLGCVETAWLFYELEWLKQPSEMISNVTVQNLWIDLCSVQGDFGGLKAAQIAMAPIFDQNTDLENRFRLAIAELDGRWSSVLSNDGTDISQIALHLHKIGADKAFSQLLSVPAMMESEQRMSLLEANYRVVWRSNPWKIGESTQMQINKDPVIVGIDFKTRSRDAFVKLPTVSNLALQRGFDAELSDSEDLEDVRRKSLSILSDWNVSAYKLKSEQEGEKMIYLLQKSICCEDWKHVSKLINNRRDSLVDGISFNEANLQDFSMEMNLLKTWTHVCDLENKQHNSRSIAHLALLQSSIEQCIKSPSPRPSSLMEATLRFAQALSNPEDEEVSSLNTQAQLQLADLYIAHGSALHAEHLLKTIPPGKACSSQLLNMKRDIAIVLTRSKLQHLCGETSLACARLNGVLQEASQCLSNLKVSHDLPSRLLLESYLSSTVLLCKWFAESGSMSLADLISQKLKPAIELTEKCWPPEVKPPLHSSAGASALLAEFADAQFQTFDEYLRSPEFAARRRLLTDADADAACLTEVDNKSRFLRLLQRQSTIESTELSNLFSSLQTFFSTAILSYCRCLAQSDKFNLKVYRLVSLWLNAVSQMAENRGLAGYSADGIATSTETLFTPAWLKSLSSHLAGIREDKFLPLFPQLLVRLMTTSSNPEGGNKAQVAFKGMLEGLVKTLLSKHPYHTGFPLLSLVNADLDDTINNPAASRAKRPRTELPADRNAARIALARQLFKEVCSSNAGSRAYLFGQMQNLARAYIEWANVDVENKRNVKGDLPLPSNIALHRLSRDADQCLNLIPVVTCPPRVDPSGRYQDLVKVVGFANTYRLAGGLNLPKIVTVLCSDGRRRKQLVKGRDDPRQDAIMQQVFSAANHLLATFTGSDQSKKDKRKSLAQFLAVPMLVKTYMVVPLARRSGLIEWCEGTIPLGDWLANENTGAHQRYHPTDLSPNQAKLKLASARDKPPERRMAIFSEICSKIRPVLGYFFVENFPEPSAWYAARRRYVASLAASSILGYLVGLGDRHPQNLLLQPSTGEVVHIDLGIAFDQGRLLPTPEMVPFRLTRDLVHALGPLGVETGFLGAAESALRSFSSGSEIILTLLEVLLHDPLYSWSLSPAQLCALEARRAEVTGGFVFQGGENSAFSVATNATGAVSMTTGRPRDSVNQLAERVLLTVRDKLAGRVGGIGSGALTGSVAGGASLGTLEPAGHAALLVRAATDPKNLGRMYFGWQAYL